MTTYLFISEGILLKIDDLADLTEGQHEELFALCNISEVTSNEVFRFLDKICAVL